MRRRVWIAGIVGAGLAFPALRARGADPDRPPTSVDQALEQIETLISPDALAAFYSAREDDVRELHMGLLHIYLARGWNAAPGDEYIPSLAADLRARKVPASESYSYLLTALWRRKHRLPLDTSLILKSIERQERLHSDKVHQLQSSLTDDRETFLWKPVVYFDGGSVRPQKGEDAIDYAVKALQKPTSVCAQAEVQGHASGDEPDAVALSVARARAVVARLVRRGVAPPRLAAHGLGTRFPAPAQTVCSPGARNQSPPVDDCVSPTAPAARAPDRDRRVEIFCLRRHWVPFAAVASPTPPATRNEPSR